MSAPVDVAVLDGDWLDQPLLARLTAAVNSAYAIGEHGLWRLGTSRTDLVEVAAIAARGELAVAASAGVAVGCVRVHDLDDGSHATEIGMLTVDPAHQGRGLGGVLMAFAEDRARSAGRTAVQLDLLVPAVGTHPVKEDLARWYARRGYAVVDRTTVRERHPELVDDLAVPCDVLVWRKPL